MSADLTAEDRALLQAPNYAWIVTLNPDGSPQASVTWIDADDDPRARQHRGRAGARTATSCATRSVAIAVQRGARRVPAGSRSRAWSRNASSARRPTRTSTRSHAPTTASRGPRSRASSASVGASAPSASFATASSVAGVREQPLAARMRPAEPRGVRRAAPPRRAGWRFAEAPGPQGVAVADPVGSRRAPARPPSPTCWPTPSARRSCPCRRCPPASPTPAR